jgi:hypothetical protein
MLVEKRRKQRRPVERRVWIDRGDGSPLAECVLGNLSEAGAKLMCKVRGDLPPEFVLRFVRDGRVARKCRVAWRTGTEIGVTFTARLVGGDGVPQAAET